MKQKVKNKEKKKILIIFIIILVIIGLIVGISINLNNKKYEYEIVEILNEQIKYYKLEQDKKYGVIDKEGNIIIEPKYTMLDIPNPTKDIFIVQEEGNANYYAIDSAGNKIYTQYESVEAININTIASNIPYEKSVLKYKQNGLYGIIDFDGKEITDSIYDSISSIDYKEGCLKVELEGKYGVINIKGTEILKPEYDLVLADGYYDEESKYENAGFILRIKTDDGYRFGYADKKGKIILEPLYNEVNRITELEGKDIYLITSNNGRYGLLKNGKEILKNEYTEISFYLSNNLLIVEKDKTKGIVNLEGDNIIPIDYDDIIMGGKYINAQKGDELVIFDSNGNNINTDIISLNEVTDNYSIVIDKDNNYNIVDKNGTKKLKNIYTYIEYYKDDKFIVSKEGKAGIIDGEGNVIIDLKYSSIQKVEGTNALQAVDSETNRTDIIDEELNVNEGITGAFLTKKDNYIKMYSETNMKYYSLSGKEVEYKDIYPNNQMYADNKDGKWGLIDKNGNIIVPYEYEAVTEQNGNVAGVKQDGKWYIVDASGKKVTDNGYTIDWLDVTFLGKYYMKNTPVSRGIIYSGTIYNNE